MTWSQVGTPVTAAFADGGTGHVVDYGSAPAVGDFDILFVNSDTIVTTPTGFTLHPNASQVSNQGAYGYYRKAVGGEASTVTVTTSGNFNAVVSWVRWRGGNAFGVAVGAQINSAVGGTTPPIDTGVLAETGELVVVAALLHHLATPEPNSPVWSAGYTGLTSVTQGAGTTGCVQFTGYKTGAGTAAETPSCTWTDGAFDRYAIALTFTAAPLGGFTAVATGSTIAAAGSKTAPGQSALPAASSIATLGSKGVTWQAANPAGATITPGTSKGGAGQTTQPASAGITAAGHKTGTAAPALAAGGSVSASGVKAASGTATQPAGAAIAAAGAKHVSGTCQMGAASRIRPQTPADVLPDLAHLGASLLGTGTYGGALLDTGTYSGSLA